MTTTYEVVVGNVGTVYDGENRDEAQAAFDAYVEQSKNTEGSRAYGEYVTMFEYCVNSADIVQEHAGHLYLSGELSD